MNLLFNSRSLEYKKPFGAVATDEKITITFPVPAEFGAEKVYFILRLHSEIRTLGLEKNRTENGYDFFTLEFSIDIAGTYYYRFEMVKGGIHHFVGKGTGSKAIKGDWLPEWQLSVYDKSFDIPENNLGGVIYQIFADRFHHEGEKVCPKYGKLKEWHEDVDIHDSEGNYLANDFFGGNFKGITAKLPYLEELGVTMIYLSPVFESHSNHRYDTGDYMKLDSLLGNEDDFRTLISEAEKRGISLILDGVFNHTGADSLYFNKFNRYPTVGAYQSKQSPYYEWFTFSSFPDEYDCWWGITCVPTVSRHSKAFQELIAGKGGVIEKWTNFGIKGWRLDVVDELSDEFLEKIREAIKENSDEVLVIGEVWEDASTKFSYGQERKYFQGKQLDAVMNYPFKEAILAYALNGKAENFIESVMTISENYPEKALCNSMTLTGTHDTVRAINGLSGINVSGTDKAYRKARILTDNEYELGKKRLLMASVLQFFLPGIPNIYYGDEIGMQGFEDPLNRRPFKWDDIDFEILNHYKKLGSLRKTYRKSFAGLLTNIEHKDNVLFLRRDNILLICNASGKDFDLIEAKADYLTGETVSRIENNTAAIFLL